MRPARSRPFGTGELASRGSLYLTRSTLGDFVATREALDVTAGDLFGMVQGRVNRH